MSLSREEVRRVAALARLRLSSAEEELYAAQLSRVVEHIDRLPRYATAEAEAPATVDTREAEDLVAPCLARERLLANAPEAEDPFLVVPEVLGGGGSA